MIVEVEEVEEEEPKEALIFLTPVYLGMSGGVGEVTPLLGRSGGGGGESAERGGGEGGDLRRRSRDFEAEEEEEDVDMEVVEDAAADAEEADVADADDFADAEELLEPRLDLPESSEISSSIGVEVDDNIDASSLLSFSSNVRILLSIDPLVDRILDDEDDAEEDVGDVVEASS